VNAPTPWPGGPVPAGKMGPKLPRMDQTGAVVTDPEPPRPPTKWSEVPMPEYQPPVPAAWLKIDLTAALKLAPQGPGPATT
jgi:hypothetical protein